MVFHSFLQIKQRHCYNKKKDLLINHKKITDYFPTHLQCFFLSLHIIVISTWLSSQPLVEAWDRHKFVYHGVDIIAIVINKVSSDNVGTSQAVLHNGLSEVFNRAKFVLAVAPQFTETVDHVKYGVDEPYNTIARVTAAADAT